MGDEELSNHYNLDFNLDLSLGLSVNIPTTAPLPSSPVPNHDTGDGFLFQPNNNNNNNNNTFTYLVPPLEDPPLLEHPVAPRRPATRSRRTTTQEAGVETIVPLFPWATNHPAGIHSLAHLTSLGHLSIEGEMACRRCDNRDRIAYDLHSKFREAADFVIANAHNMHDRAPSKWMNPLYPDCSSCKQNSCMRPVLADRKEEINWLFLFLGQTLGICTLEQLKWFCKYRHKHRTGAKDRVLYLSYISICIQLQPDGTFDSLLNNDQ